MNKPLSRALLCCCLAAGTGCGARTGSPAAVAAAGVPVLVMDYSFAEAAIAHARGDRGDGPSPLLGDRDDAGPLAQDQARQRSQSFLPTAAQ